MVPGHRWSRRPGIDQVVARVDADAVRRRKKTQADRKLSIWDSGNGLTEVFGRLASIEGPCGGRPVGRAGRGWQFKARRTLHQNLNVSAG